MPNQTNFLNTNYSTLNELIDTTIYNTIANYNTPLYNHQNNTLAFYNNKNIWIMKIQENKILFNTEQITIDEITKIFLQKLEQLTHKEGLQYTFVF